MEGHWACTETLWALSVPSSHVHEYSGAFMGKGVVMMWDRHGDSLAE